MKSYPESLVRRAGELRPKARRGSAVDAILVTTAESGGTVLSGDSEDLKALAGHADRVRVRSDALLWSQVGDEVVLLDRRNDTYLGVNASGAALWPLLVDGCERAQLVGRLMELYGIDEQRADTDVDSLIADLAGQGLLAAAEG